MPHANDFTLRNLSRNSLRELRKGILHIESLFPGTATLEQIDGTDIVCHIQYANTTVVNTLLIGPLMKLLIEADYSYHYTNAPDSEGAPMDIVFHVDQGVAPVLTTLRIALTGNLGRDQYPDIPEVAETIQCFINLLEVL